MGRWQTGLLATAYQQSIDLAPLLPGQPFLHGGTGLLQGLGCVLGLLESVDDSVHICVRCNAQHSTLGHGHGQLCHPRPDTGQCHQLWFSSTVVPPQYSKSRGRTDISHSTHGDANTYKPQKAWYSRGDRCPQSRPHRLEGICEPQVRWTGSKWEQTQQLGR